MVRFHRFDRPTDTWLPVEWDDIKKDDAIWIDGEGGSETILAASDRDPVTDLVDVYYVIDPATNEWVLHPGVGKCSDDSTADSSPASASP